jgi:RNA polymerase sigma-70 factor, ECF subfamily
MNDATAEIQMGLLVLRCQLGDRQSLESLIRYFDSRLRGFVFKMLPSRSQNLDDLIQDIWAAALQDLVKLDDAAAFPPWLFRIARNRVVSALRQRNPVWVPFDEAENSRDAEIDEQFTAADAAAVHLALDELPPQQREVLLLRFMEEMSYADIATVVGCAIGTVRSRIHQGKRALRAILERESIHD